MNNQTNDLNNQYYLAVINPTEKDNFNIPYILFIPKQIQSDSVLAIQINSKESNDLEEILEEGLDIITNLQNNLQSFNNPILVPLIPKSRDTVNFKHLSKECFNLDNNDLHYRIDNQVLNIITKVKEDIKKITGITINDKVFIAGYSTSGLFAQRFALLHPEIIDTICVGGVIGSIPFPSKVFKYPLGIGNIESLTGKKFNIINYLKIKFNYYSCAFENDIKTDIKGYDGNYISLYDSSYFDKDMDNSNADKYRVVYGIEMIERSERVIDHLKNIGIRITKESFAIEKPNKLKDNEFIQKYICESYSDMKKEKDYNKIFLKK